jgi:hypothetical protein
MGFRAVTPNININTESGQLRTELLNTFTRLDGQLALAPYRLSYTVGPVGSSGASDVLSSATVTYGTLAKNGMSILVNACGRTAANANNKNIYLYFGSTTIFQTGLQAFNDVDWVINAEIVRTSSTSQVAWVNFFATATLEQKIEVVTSSENLATNRDIEIRGGGTADNDVLLDYCKTTLLS